MAGRVGAQSISVPGRQFALVAMVVGGCRLESSDLTHNAEQNWVARIGKGGACGVVRTQRALPNGRCRSGAGTRAAPGYCQDTGLHILRQMSALVE